MTRSPDVFTIFCSYTNIEFCKHFDIASLIDVFSKSGSWGSTVFSSSFKRAIQLWGVWESDPLVGTLCSGPHHWPGQDLFRAALKYEALLPQSFLFPCLHLQVSELHHSLNACPSYFYSTASLPSIGISLTNHLRVWVYLGICFPDNQSDPLSKTGKVSLGLLLPLLSQHKHLSMGDLPWSFIWNSPFHFFLCGLFIFHGIYY